MERESLRSLNHNARLLLVAAQPHDLNQAKRILHEFSDRRGGKLEIFSCTDLESAHKYLTYYLNGILLIFPGNSASNLMAPLKKLRRAYSGRIGLVNNDPSVPSYTWGRVGGVDFYCDRIEASATFADMVFARRLGKGKTALLLEGGGVLGGFIEFGALRALYDYGIRDFDIYTGISAGAFVAACAANKIPFRMMLERRRLEWAQIYYPNFGEFIDKVGSFFPNLYRGVTDFWNEPNKDIPLFLSSFFMTSLLSAKRIKHFLEKILQDAKGTNNFLELRKRHVELYIIATDLDTTERRIFGGGSDVKVPISQAVEASIALPLTFSPVEIGGRYYVDGAICNAANLDIAVEHGADLIICVNPLVPFISKKPGLMKNLGPLGILEQSYRSILHQMLLRKIESYKSEHPQVTTILIEPDPEDPTMFHNPLNASKKLMDLALVHGYKSAREAIQNQFDFVQKSFLYHGIEVQRELVDNKLKKAESSKAGHKSRKVMRGSSRTDRQFAFD